MIHSYSDFIRENQSEAEKIHQICQQYKINNYKINDDFSIDVQGDVNLASCKLVKLPLHFRNVTGNFNCNSNLLTTLEGSPRSVGDYFNCDINQLTTLIGGPVKVGSGFSCDYNKIRTFEGCPHQMNRFYCVGNPIEVIWKLFRFTSYQTQMKFLDKVNFIYTDLFNGPEMIRGDVLEQIAEELEVELPTNRVERLEKTTPHQSGFHLIGYQVI